MGLRLDIPTVDALSGHEKRNKCLRRGTRGSRTCTSEPQSRRLRFVKGHILC